MSEKRSDNAATLPDQTKINLQFILTYVN